jgi:uncharacterized protein YcfL
MKSTILICLIFLAFGARADTNSLLVEVIELRGRVSQLENEVAKLKAKAQQPNMDQAGLLARPTVKVESAEMKTVEVSEWSYVNAYNLRVKNTANLPLKVDLCVQFYDAQGFTVSESTEYNVVFQPNETRAIHGQGMVRTPAAATVKGVRAKVFYK